ncbi:hypothetical protein GF312_00575 [Candidatus Poribacteria bacterium]|nr:hypothetical protein [Candidatus Poribacteria bacterium]
MYVGWIRLHRSLTDHWIWKDKPFTKGQAWIDILLECNHREGKFNQKGVLMICKRGESLNSLDTWAWRWGWNKSKVRRFLKLLQKDNMIELKSETITTRLTICNYDKWQTDRHADETEMKRKRNASETQVTPNKNDKNDKNDKKRIKKVLMKNSGITQEDIKQDFKKTTDIKTADPEYYYNTALDWSSSKGELRIDWLATVRNFARKDLKDGKLKCRGRPQQNPGRENLQQLGSRTHETESMKELLSNDRYDKSTGMPDFIKHKYGRNDTNSEKNGRHDTTSDDS